MHPLDGFGSRVRGERLFSGPLSRIVAVLAVLLSFAAIYLVAKLIS